MVTRLRLACSVTNANSVVWSLSASRDEQDLLDGAAGLAQRRDAQDQVNDVQGIAHSHADPQDHRGTPHCRHQADQDHRQDPPKVHQDSDRRRARHQQILSSPIATMLLVPRAVPIGVHEPLSVVHHVVSRCLRVCVCTTVPNASENSLARPVTLPLAGSRLP